MNTASAMSSHSRILITDTAIPGVHASREMALQDLNMMSFGGLERTEREWSTLLDSAGLKLVTIWKDMANKQAVIEARLS